MKSPSRQICTLLFQRCRLPQPRAAAAAAAAGQQQGQQQQQQQEAAEGSSSSRGSRGSSSSRDKGSSCNIRQRQQLGKINAWKTSWMLTTGFVSILVRCTFTYIHIYDHCHPWRTNNLPSILGSGRRGNEADSPSCISIVRLSKDGLNRKDMSRASRVHVCPTHLKVEQTSVVVDR